MLTGNKIYEEYHRGRIIIHPFEKKYLDINSYSVHLGETLLIYSNDILDAKEENAYTKITIPDEGFILQPGEFYLGHTIEQIGGLAVASELYADCSTANLGMFIQTSAPFGHTGAAINWTLEIVVARKIRVYSGMKIGKVCFWQNFGEMTFYDGRYNHSTTVITSRIAMDNT